MQQAQGESLCLQLIETTCILNRVINTNCAFDGSHIIYLSGSSIVYHNVFQNNKTFLQRATDYQIVAMAFYRSAELSIVLVTKSGDGQCHLQFYFSAKKGLNIDIHQDLQVVDVVFLQKKKVMILGHDNAKKTPVLIIVTSHKKFRRIDISEPAFKLLCNERKVLMLTAQGCLQLNIDRENLLNDKKYIKFAMVDAILLENEYQIIIDRNNYLHYFNGSDLVQSLQLGNNSQSIDKLQYQTCVRIGRSLLIAYKNHFILSYYEIKEEGLQFISNFQYSEKLRANILTLQSSVDEMNLVIAIQIFHKDQFRIEHFLFNLSVLSHQKKFVNPFHRIIANGAEMGEVSSLQKIVPSEVYYLVGPSIINYSYVENIEKKHKYIIHESPKLVAVHPLGHQIVCIFETCIKFYQKIEMELVQTWTEQMICSAAKYTDSGILILGLYQDNNHQVMTYNPNSFRRMRTYSGLYLKHAITKIQLDDNQAELILYSGKDLFVHKLKTGQKTSEFREKKQCVEALCIQYDYMRKQLLVGGSKYLMVCCKLQDYCLNFTNQKLIRLEEEITCIYIRQNIHKLFLGTTDGKILFCDYPLQIQEEEVQDEDKIYKVKFSSFKLHYLPVIDLLLTNNCKFLLTNVRGEGMSILRLKRTGATTNGYNHFDISNFNFIETSSKPYLEGVHDKLRMLLQKRKTIFNELEEFKKEWENKRICETKSITTIHKKKELDSINSTLSDIAKVKLQHQSLEDGLALLEIDSQKMATDAELLHHRQLIQSYENSNKLKNKKREVESRCNQQYENIMEQCHQNIQEIRAQLQLKFTEFEGNYILMKQNLVDFNRRMQIETEEDQLLRSEEVEGMRRGLKQEEEYLQKNNSELKGQISKSKKQLERFVNRKDFLQNKMRFFVEELKYCGNEQDELLEIKKDLETQLIELEEVTHKKEKRLRKYFMENEILIKYQLIHDNLIKQEHRETDFIEHQHLKIKNSINELQLQILNVSKQRELHSIQLERKSKLLQQLKDSKRHLKQKYSFLQLQIVEMEREMESVNQNKVMDEGAKNKEYMNIYNNYFVNKKLQAVISSEKAKDGETLAAQNRIKQQKIKQVLEDHRDYLLKNMNLFQKYNSRIIDEINLTYLKHQTDNYNLISECNLRKQQIIKNKRILHQLTDSVKQTTNYMTQLQRGDTSNKPQPTHTDNFIKDIPFISYEQKQQQQLRQREKMALRSQKSESALWNIKKSSYQVRKMLETQKIKGLTTEKSEKFRRIQTATLKKKPMDSSHQQAMADQSIDVMTPINYLNQPRKPLTAARRRPNGLALSREGLMRNKSNSKPTTCTSHSKYSVFM